MNPKKKTAWNKVQAKLSNHLSESTCAKLSKHGKGFWKVAQIHHFDVKLTSGPTAHLPHVGQKQKSVELAGAAVQEGKQPESAGPAKWRVANRNPNDPSEGRH